MTLESVTGMHLVAQSAIFRRQQVLSTLLGLEICHAVEKLANNSGHTQTACQDAVGAQAASNVITSGAPCTLCMIQMDLISVLHISVRTGVTKHVWPFGQLSEVGHSFPMVPQIVAICM